MTDMRDLYQEVILDHNRKPRNFGDLEGHNRHAHGHNPLCGDDYEVFAIVEDGVVSDVKFHGKGCAISKAAASMMTARVKGQTVEYAEDLVASFRDMMSTGSADGHDELKHLRVFEGVSQLPSRVKCAVLPWHTLHAALTEQEEISTEGDHDQWSDEFPDPDEAV